VDKTPQVKLHSTSHYFLEGLNEIGIENLFCNLGTDHAPLIEEMARWQKDGRTFPKTFLCPHENTAMHMAAGYAMVTGRGQAVMVHVDSGTTNAAMAMHNTRRGKVPLILMAGRAPYTVRGELPGSRDNYVHFIQEPFDQAAIVRNYTKWEWTLPSGVIAKEVLRRIHSVAHSDPPGPVYLMLPREVLTQTWDENAIRSFPAERFGPAGGAAASKASIEALADKLLAAKHPILITTYAGRNQAAPAVIEELAMLAGIRVFETAPVYISLSRKSVCHGGYVVANHVPQADVGLMVDVDVPWIPKEVQENPKSWWAHIDVDVVKSDFPIWGFPTNLRMGGDATTILRQLVEALKAKATPAFRDAVAKRMEAIKKEHAERWAGIAKLGADKGTKGAVGVNYVCAEVAKALGENDIIVNEAVRNIMAVLNQVPRTKPGTALGFAGGGLGGSGGMALGAKLARPDSTVVQFVGDGGFYFGNPSSVYAVAKQYKLPIFTVVLDNSGWAAVKEATLRMYPDGDAKAAAEYQSRLAPEIEYTKVCEAAGGHGELVLDPELLPGAVRRCIAAVKSGRAALLQARIPSL
jgi:acetolactate synthase I/II/III large subunit